MARLVPALAMGETSSPYDTAAAKAVARRRDDDGASLVGGSS
jgi:hypothetical protein